MIQPQTPYKAQGRFIASKVLGLREWWKIRHSSCFCINCKLGTGACINNHLVLPWERKQLLGGKLNDATINHWEKVNECDV